MKKSLLFVLLISLALMSPLFGYQTWNFDNAADVTPWNGNWNNNGNSGTITLSVTSTGAHTGSACMLIVVNKTISSGENAFNVQLDATSAFSNFSTKATDTYWKLWLKTDPATADTTGGPGVFVQDNGWGWSAGAWWPPVPSAWTEYTYNATPAGHPYQRVGVQVNLSSYIGIYNMYLDDAEIGPAASVADWALMATKE